jgi:predicted ATPase
MLKKFHLQRFKNFKDTALELGSFTLLVGTNASGKSNIRDAFRFIHGISRGYSLAEIIGEKWIEGGVLQWRGIRGGIREIAFQGTKTFSLEVLFYLGKEKSKQEAIYYIEINSPEDGKPLSIANERLSIVGQKNSIFNAKFNSNQEEYSLLVKVFDNPVTNRPVSFNHHRPIICQLAELSTDVWAGEGAFVPATSIKGIVKSALQAFSSVRFLDLDPEAMRIPSLPGQTILGDRGENLSSVLQAICEDLERKQTLIQWLRELTPMDAKDFEFPSDFTGKILLTLVEENGQKTSAYSASDGTLRFLAIIAALLGPEPARFYFFEELENGIHPTRLHLLIQLIERQVTARNIQIVATTHSPQLLGLLSEESLKYASLIYRLEGSTDARIKRILDIPDAKRVIEEQDLVRLHASGWLEDAMEFLDSEEASE